MLALPGDLDKTLPTAPILRHLELMGGPYAGLTAAGYPQESKDRDRLDKALQRAIKRGYVSIAVADQLCCEVLRVHPALVYGDAWWDGTLDPAWLEHAS